MLSPSPSPPPPGSPDPTDEPGETPSSSARGALGVGQQRQTLPAPLEELLESSEPLLVFKYDRPIGRQWINTKKYADLFKEALTIMCQTDCNFHPIPERFKKDGHLLTTSPELLPSLRIQKLASMGSKYRPSPYPGEFNSTNKQEVLSVLCDPILAYADSVERRVGMTGVMNAWACSVLAASETQLDTIRYGTPLCPAGGIPYTSHDRRDMHRFLEGFVGHGVVCSIMDKASYTLTWQCPLEYCRRLMKNLTSNGVYQVSTEDATTVIARHVAFLTDQGMAIDASSQAIPYHIGCPKMHKDPVDM
ncbi:TPA: hypothetical protein ACH3X1_001250 [Trebouxia sp. C0004]